MEEVECSSIEERCGGTDDCFATCMCVERDVASCQTHCRLSDDDPLLAPLGSRHSDWAEFELEVVELTNTLRDEGGCCAGQCFAPTPPLVMDDNLRRAARRYAHQLAERGKVSHIGEDGRDAFARIRAAGVRSCAMGENITARRPTAAEAVDAWLQSPAHCENLYFDEYSRVGVGYALAFDTELGSVWVQEFAGP